MDYFVQALRNNPELAVFLTLAIGFLIGRVKFGSFSLGIVVGTLLAGVLIGQLDIKVPAIVKTIFFDLFLFTTGYKVGPQFFRGLKRDAAALDEWCREIAPSNQLRAWYGHDPDRWAEFAARYRAELDDPQLAVALARLADLARAQTVTLLTASKAVEISDATVIAHVLREML